MGLSYQISADSTTMDQRSSATRVLLRSRPGIAPAGNAQSRLQATRELEMEILLFSVCIRSKASQS